MERVSRRKMIAGIAAGIAAPRLAQAQSSRRVTLRITHAFVAIHQPMVAALVRRFMELNPDIAVDAQPGGDNWDPLLQATLRSGIVGDLPDVSHQSLAYTRVFQRRGYVQPLDRFIADSGGVEAL